MRVLILFSAVFSKTHDFEIKRLQTRCTYLLMSASSWSNCFLREQHITSKPPNPKKFCSGFLSSSYGFGSTWMASKYAILVFLWAHQNQASKGSKSDRIQKIKDDAIFWSSQRHGQFLWYCQFYFYSFPKIDRCYH